MSRVIGFEPDFKLEVNGKFEYAVLLDEFLYCEEGEYESHSVRISSDGVMHFTAEDYFISDVVEDDLDGVAMYIECVNRDDEFEDHTKLAQEIYDNDY